MTARMTKAEFIRTFEAKDGRYTNDVRDALDEMEAEGLVEWKVEEPFALGAVVETKAVGVTTDDGTECFTRWTMNDGIGAHWISAVTGQCFTWAQLEVRGKLRVLHNGVDISAL